MRISALISGLLLTGGVAIAQPASPDAKLRQIIAPVSGAEMKRTVDSTRPFGARSDSMSSFGRFDSRARPTSTVSAATLVRRVGSSGCTSVPAA